MSDPAANTIVTVGKARFGNALPLALIAGPCQLESRAHALEMATALRELCARLKIDFVYKTSFDKANRTSGKSARGIGLDQALPIFAEVRETLGVPVLTDVHEAEQCARAAQAVDVLQIPAFLCRQTDLLAAAGASGCVVNVKKGQFMAAEDMGYAVEKAGGRRVLLTERGTSFGYHDLVVDYRGLGAMRRFAPVIFDSTHSVQSPGGAGGRSGGKREHIPALTRAAVAVGVDGIFLETHPDPDRALSDGPNMLALDDVGAFLRECLAIHAATSGARA
jgi:2-dehydro-3-deoxyphosphooctonate aldolase (KDO 8-P synthase)